MEKQRYFEWKGRRIYYDATIYMKQVDPEHLILTQPYHYDEEVIPEGFMWDGASSPPTPLLRWFASKFYKNIIASCVHDYKCRMAQSRQDRVEADMHYRLCRKFVEGSTGLIATVSWLGVRLGAKLGIGIYF